MNVYRCWHDGTSGYAGRLDRKYWLFVPDLAQPDNHIYRNIQLSELTFKNRIEYDYEMEQLTLNRLSLMRLLESLLFSTEQPNTTAGLLLMPQSR